MKLKLEITEPRFNLFVFACNLLHTDVVASYSSFGANLAVHGDIWDYLGVSEAERYFFKDNSTPYRLCDGRDTIALSGKRGTVFIYCGTKASAGLCIAIETYIRPKATARLILLGAVKNIIAAPSFAIDDNILRKGDGDAYNSICNSLEIIRKMLEKIHTVIEGSSTELSRNILQRVTDISDYFDYPASVEIRQGISLVGTANFDWHMCVIFMFSAVLCAKKYAPNKEISFWMEKFGEGIAIGFEHELVGEEYPDTGAMVFRNMCDARGMLNEFSIRDGKVRSRICPVYPEWSLLGVKSDSAPRLF